MAETLPWKTKDPFILFVNPSMGTKTYEREDKLRSYLSLGTLASALGDKAFLQRFAHQVGKEEFILQNESDYPSFDVRIANLSLKPKKQTIKKYLEEFIGQNGLDPVMVCTTATSAQIRDANEVARAAKYVAPNALRVIGGPHVSVMPLEQLSHSDYQVACVGEGVETLTELALRFTGAGDGDLSKVSGIAYKGERGEARLTPPRKYIFALDDYPFPSDSIDLFLDDLDETRRNEKDIVYIFVGSGCPYHCVFCAQHAIHKGRIRERSAQKIFAEIRKLHTRGFRRFAMVQETFLCRRGRIDAFCNLIEDSGLKFEWTIEARADQLNFPLLKRMRDAGLRFIQIGVETGDQELLDHLGKGIELDQVKKLRDWCEALKVHTAFYMLVGLPRQGWQSILRSALFLRDHTPYNRVTMHIPVSIAIPYPGTKIAKERSVRLLAPHEGTLNWPDRNPQVSVNENGAFEGEGVTETDHMTSGELLEAFTYLDDFGHFLLHEKYDSSYSHVERAKAGEFVHRIIYMIERRTIRDLIVRAQADPPPEGRRIAYLELLEIDAGKEKHFKDVTEFFEQSFKTFTDFLTAIKFKNGFHTMKCLSIPNRIKWMKLCAIMWELTGRKLNSLGFQKDKERTGEALNLLLERVNVHTLNRLLERLDEGIIADPFLEDITSEILLTTGAHKGPLAKTS
ncbi:MAG: radical SAM protein [Desulfobacteraceae bacterium]|nr:radical SAM protein [Desulfobacteraceae bacterium]